MSDDKPEVEVEESAGYDNCLDENLETMPEDPQEPLQNNLADLMGIDPQPYSTEKWREHWEDMPEYNQESNPSYKTLIVHFRNENDYKEFASLVNQPLTEKTKTIWHPKLERTPNSLLRWIEPDEN